MRTEDNVHGFRGAHGRRAPADERDVRVDGWSGARVTLFVQEKDWMGRLEEGLKEFGIKSEGCLLYTSPSPRD